MAVNLDPIGVGIIGTGFWGRKLAAEYLDAEHRGRVKLIKVCDSSIAALGTLLINHETTSICEERLTLNIRDVLDNPEVSAVHIATSYETHNAFARMALEAGKNVLVEEPMALSSSEFHQLVDLAAEKGLVIEDAHSCRFNPAVQAAGEMLRRGDIGKISYVRVQWTDPSNLADGDIIFDLGPEPFDILNLLLGSWPREVSGVAGTQGNSRHDEIVHIFAEYPDHIVAHIELSWLHPRKVRELFVVGSQATLVVDCTNQRILKRSAGINYEIPVIASNIIASEIDHFVDKILHGDLAADQTGSRTIETLEVVRSFWISFQVRWNWRPLLGH